MALCEWETQKNDETEMNAEDDENGTPEGASVRVHLRMSGVLARSRRAPAERTASKARKTVS